MADTLVNYAESIRDLLTSSWTAGTAPLVAVIVDRKREDVGQGDPKDLILVSEKPMNDDGPVDICYSRYNNDTDLVIDLRSSDNTGGRIRLDAMWNEVRRIIHANRFGIAAMPSSGGRIIKIRSKRDMSDRTVRIYRYLVTINLATRYGQI